MFSQLYIIINLVKIEPLMKPFFYHNKSFLHVVMASKWFVVSHTPRSQMGEIDTLLSIRFDFKRNLINEQTNYRITLMTLLEVILVHDHRKPFRIAKNCK